MCLANEHILNIVPCHSCIPFLFITSIGLHFLFFFFHIHLQLLGRVWRKPSAVVMSVTFPISWQGWAAVEISSLMFSRHLSCSSPADFIRELTPTPPNSPWSYAPQTTCPLLPLLSKAGSCHVLFNCLCKWQIVWYRQELWNSNLPTDASEGEHSSACPFMVVWRCSHLSASHDTWLSPQGFALLFGSGPHK